MRLSLPVILIVFVQISNAQGFNFGITAGGNISTVFKQSDYEINDANYNQSQYIPLPGFEFGIFTSHPLSEKIVVTNTLDFARLAYKSKDEVTLTSPLGEPIWTTDQIKYCSGYLRLRPILSYTFFDKLKIGTGIQMNVLLLSRTNLGNDAPIEFDETFNRYYKTITFSVPLSIGYQFFPFEIGVMASMGIDNRIKGDASLIKEREGSLALKFSYYFLSTAE